MVGRVPPLTLNAVRWLLAALILLPLGFRALANTRAIARQWRYLLIVGSLGVGAYNALQYLALETSTPINVTLIAAGMPVWMLAIGALFFDVPPTRRQLLGASLSIVGVLLVIVRGSMHALASVQLVRGDLYILAAVIAWSFYSWLLARPPGWLTRGAQPAWSWSEFLLLQISFGMLVAGSAAAFEHALYDLPIDCSFAVIAALVFVAVGPAVVAYRCWGLGVVEGGPTLAALFSNLTPLFAALLSAVVLGETPRWFHGAAFALIVAGIIASSSGPLRD